MKPTAQNRNTMTDNNNDDMLQSLFDGFRPRLSSDAAFMQRLTRRLETVEALRRENQELRRRSRKALGIGAFIGFVAGLLFSLIIPYIATAAESLKQSLNVGNFLGAGNLTAVKSFFTLDNVLFFFADNYLIFTLLIIGATSVFIAINAYDLSLILLKPKNPIN